MPTVLRVAKDPDDIESFTWDWSNRLTTGETIATRDVSVDAGTVVSSAISGAFVSAVISGGTNGSYINARCRITTSSGRQLDWTIQIPIAVQ